MSDRKILQTKESVTNEFMADLNSLLLKYGAEIEAEDHFEGYAECGEDIRITATIPAIYDNGEIVREWIEIDLGRWIRVPKTP